MQGSRSNATMPSMPIEESLRDRYGDKHPDIDPISSIIFREDPSKACLFLRIPTEPDAIEHADRALARGTMSWTKLLIVHCARIARMAVSGSPDLASAIRDLMETCVLWITQIEGQRNSSQLR